MSHPSRGKDTRGSGKAIRSCTAAEFLPVRNKAKHLVFNNAGMTYLVFSFTPPYLTGTPTTLAENVMPMLEQRYDLTHDGDWQAHPSNVDCSYRDVRLLP